MNNKTALLAGASGLIGAQLLRLLLEGDVFEPLICVGRRHLDLTHPRLKQFQWEDPSLTDGRAQGPIHTAFITLGTTMKRAGSRERFREVDLDLVVRAASLAKSNGARQCLVVSALGADPRSGVFYNRVKGEMEAALSGLGFDHLVILRPSLLLGHREEFRLAEAIGQFLGRIIGPLMGGPLRRYRPIEAATVAEAMLVAATREIAKPGAVTGVQILESEEIGDLVRTGRL